MSNPARDILLGDRPLNLPTTYEELAVYAHDEKGTRTDVHRPSVINPGDYKYLSVSEKRAERKEGKKVGGPAGTCHHCGKAIVWEVNYQHLPSGNLVTFGYICAGILDLTDNRIDHEMVLLKRAAENERRQYEWDEQIRYRRVEMERNRPDLCRFLDELDLEYEEMFVIKNMKWGYDKYGSLRDWEIVTLDKILKARADFIARKLAEPTPESPVVEGKYTVEGVVQSTKLKPSLYNPEGQLKMMVMLDDGNKVWGSVPKSILSDDLKGKRVRFDATVEKSDNDEHFGYFSRPTKATVV